MLSHSVDRQVQRYGDLARQLGIWVGNKEKVVPHRTGSLLLRTQASGYMENEPLCLVVSTYHLTVFTQVGGAVGKSSAAFPPFADECLIRLF